MALNPTTTRDAAKAFAPDLVAFTPQEAVPEALILKASTVVSQSGIGDAPSVLVPWVREESATWAAEGAELDLTPPGLSQVQINVRKVTQFFTVSNELWNAEAANNPEVLSTSSMRAVTKAANTAFVQGVATAANPLVGIANTEGIIEGGNITTSLDPLADSIAQIEANGGAPSVILANPIAWGRLRNLKTATNANTSLLGAGTEDQGKRLFGIEVITSAAVPEDQMVIIDKNSIASVVSQVDVAVSEHAAFRNDSTALRTTWRLGWAVQHPDRLATITVGAA
ncbi:phage major capsid protein [Kocuria sp. p3-SID1433]|uniref:phage major capsid protein n=2 Tax=unclassified Kocuria TaxID=2649579 RepID=UPI0021A93F6F|nr:phage major capsid protein [Kocuria sp. p3-SID1433]MCT2179573.1 phage major capsid protein [Kocuria sp. p3-SID1433]